MSAAAGMAERGCAAGAAGRMPAGRLEAGVPAAWKAALRWTALRWTAFCFAGLRLAALSWAAAMVVVLAAGACTQPAAIPPPGPAPEPVVEAVQPDAPEDRVAMARRGLELFERKEWDQAVPVLLEAASQYPEVAPFLHLRVAEAEAARGNGSEAIALLNSIVVRSDTSAVKVARLRLPVLHAQAGDPAATDAAWREAMLVPIDELTEPDFTNMATALAKAGRSDLAKETRMRLLTSYTQGRYTEQTFGFLKSELEKLPDQQRVDLAGRLSRANRYDQALALIPSDTALARSTRIRALFNSRNYSTLLAETEGRDLGDPALMLLRARAAWRNDRPQDFLAGLAAIEKRYPSSREASAAKVLRAKHHTTDKTDYAQAVRDLSKAIEAGAAGNDGENIWNLGWTYALWGRDEDALKTFDRYIRAYPDGDWKTNSLFWSAKILDKAGRAEERDARAKQIVAEFPHSYYAYRAKELWPAARLQQPASTARFPDVEGELAAITEPRLSTVQELQAIGLDRAAAREMKELSLRHADNLGVQFRLADVYVRGGEPFKANGVLQRQFRQFVRHGGTGIPRRFWQILYPLAYWETIRTEAERRGHDPYLLASIIRQESGFEPATVSNAGAVGLMQIMPEEAARIATAGGLSVVSRADLFNPETNIAVGAAELTQKLEAMNGVLTLAIAAYNAGETPVREWIARTPPADIDLFIESIPYAETRLYVKTVTRNRHEYRRIYEAD